MPPPTQCLCGFWEFKLWSSYLYSKILTTEPTPQPLGVYQCRNRQTRDGKQRRVKAFFFSLPLGTATFMLARVLNAPLSTVNHRAIFLDISTILRTPESLARYLVTATMHWCGLISVCVQETPSNSL